MSESEPREFPVKGMTIHPDSCDGFEPAFGWPGFLGCVRWCSDMPESVKAFRAEKGIGGLAWINAKVTHKGATWALFCDWVAVNVWGVEGTK